MEKISRSYQVIMIHLQKKNAAQKALVKFDLQPNSERAYPPISLRPIVVFKPTTPQREEGIRTEPALYNKLAYLINIKYIRNNSRLFFTTSTICSKCCRAYSRSYNCCWARGRSTCIPFWIMRISCCSDPTIKQLNSIHRMGLQQIMKHTKTSRSI